LIFGLTTAAQLVETKAAATSTSTVTLPLLFIEKNKPTEAQIVDATLLQITENGETRQITSIQQRKPAERLLLAVLFDSSNSQRSQFEIVKGLARLTVDKLARQNHDAVAVGIFNTNLSYTNFLTDKEKAISSFSNAAPGGGTAVFEAVYEFCSKLRNP